MYTDKCNKITDSNRIYRQINRQINKQINKQINNNLREE